MEFCHAGGKQNLIFYIIHHKAYKHDKFSFLQIDETILQCVLNGKFPYFEYVPNIYAPQTTNFIDV